MPNTHNQEEMKMKDLMGTSAFYNVNDAQKLDLCGQFQESKFILTTNDNEHLLKHLMFATSYFIRCSQIRRKKLVRLNRLREKHFKIKRVMVRRGTKKSEDSLDGVMFLLGENERLVQHTSSTEPSTDESIEAEDDSLCYMKVQLPKYALEILSEIQLLQ